MLNHITRITDAVNKNFKGIIEHSLSIDKKIEVFSAYYPVKFFDKNYAVIFSIDKEKWFGHIKSRTLVIIFLT